MHIPQAAEFFFNCLTNTLTSPVPLPLFGDIGGRGISGESINERNGERGSEGGVLCPSIACVSTAKWGPGRLTTS